MPNIFNWGMLSNPYNWLVVFLMIAIAVVPMTVIRNSLAPPQSA
jgi:hypothetical protein